MKRIYVGNLSFKTTDAGVQDAFSAYGTVHKATVVMDRETGRSRGFGFVEMDDADATTAISALNGTELDGRTLTVNEARPREDKPRSGGGYRPSSGGGGRDSGGYDRPRRDRRDRRD